jgi:GNAT superfamily N-acetyltransferase
MKNKSRLDSHAFNNLNETMEASEIMLTHEQGQVRGMIRGLYMSLGIQPQEVCLRFPAENIEGIYQGKYFAHTEKTPDRVYVTTLHPTLSTSFYIEDNTIFIFNLAVAKELRGNDIGSKALSMFKLAGIVNDLDIKLRAVPVELYDKMGVDTKTINGHRKFKQYKQALARHTFRLIKFYEKNDFTLTGEGLGAEMEFIITDELRAEGEAFKKELLAND